MKNLRIKAVLAIFFDENGDEYGDPDSYEFWEYWSDLQFDQIRSDGVLGLEIGDKIHLPDAEDLETTHEVIKFWMTTSGDADECDVKLFIGCKPLQ